MTMTSCLLCLEADNDSAMITVTIASRQGVTPLRVFNVKYCSRCCRTISAAYAQALGAKESSGQPDPVADEGGTDNRISAGLAESANPDVANHPGVDSAASSKNRRKARAATDSGSGTGATVDSDSLSESRVDAPKD
jgi:hypothetical protein